MENLHRNRLLLPIVPGQLHLSEAYFNDLLNCNSDTHSCHLQLKRIEMAKEKLRSSGESFFSNRS